MKRNSKRIFLHTLLSLAFVLSVTDFSHFSALNSYQKEKRMVVYFKDKTDILSVSKEKNKVTLNSFIKEKPTKIQKVFKHINTVIANLTETEVSELKKNKNVIIEPDKKVHSLSYKTPFDYYAQNVDWGHLKIGLSNTNNQPYTGKNVNIAIIDTGIDPQHSDVSAKYYHNFIDNTDTALDGHGHGTHVSGIIASKNNSYGVLGVAPDANIYALKVLSDDGSGFMSDVLEAVEWSISNHMDVVNMSLGSDTYSIIEENAFKKAYDSGVFLVAASGNEDDGTGTKDTTGYPAKYPSVVSVGATDYKDFRASFSSVGKVDIAAPGENILSTYTGNLYAYMSGTSMATPYVAGTIALYKEKYPSLTNNQIKRLLFQNALDLGPTGVDGLFGNGLVQVPKENETIPPDLPLDTPKPVLIDSPSGFKALNVSYNQISLNWDKRENTEYELWKDGILVYKGTGNTFVDKNLSPVKFYNYLLYSTQGGNKSPSVSLSIKTKPTPVLPIKNLSVTTYSSKISVKWQFVKGYRYELYRNGNRVYSGTNPYFTDSHLCPLTSYNYQLYQFDSYNQRSSVSFKAKTKPGTVGVYKAIGTTKNSITLRWSNINNAVFELRRDGKLIYKGSSYIFKDTRLLPNHSYTYSVQVIIHNEKSDSKSIILKTKK